VYTATTSDGCCLTPVIFTSDWSPGDVDAMGRWADSRGNQAFVHYRAAPLAPNYETTITWLHDMRDESNVQLENGCVLLLDHAGWHKKAEVQQEFEDAEIQVLLYPKRAGKWLDPQDQAFHREMRRAYVKLLTSRDGSKVGKIVEGLLRCIGPSRRGLVGPHWYAERRL